MNLDQIAEMLAKDAAGASEPDRWHLENAAYFYRCRARQLRTVSNARTLSDGVLALAGAKP